MSESTDPTSPAPEEPPLNPEIIGSLQGGMELFNARDFFEAHEVWEEQWGDTYGDERHLLQGLIQVAAGFYKLQRGMPSGTAKLLEKGVGHLEAVAADYYGLDLAPLVQSARAWQQIAVHMVEQWRTDYDPAGLPRLEWVAGPPPGH